MAIESDHVVIDATSVKPGEQIPIYGPAGFYLHPVTKKKIAKKPELLATLRIKNITSEYSEAEVLPEQAIAKLKAGMSFQLPEQKIITTQQTPALPTRTTDGRAAVVIAPAQVNDVVDNGYFGGYVSDILMEQLLMCNHVQLLDRSILNAQMEETQLKGDYIDPQTAIRQGKIAGARYLIQVTMQKPDVVNVRTGIPMASIMTAVGSIANTNVGAAYSSNIQIGTLKAQVNLSARVVDLETGEILLMTSANGKAQGKSQLSFEYGALNGGQLNGGVDGFKQTVTGQAIHKAFLVVGRNLNTYFSGQATTKVKGSTSGLINYGTKMHARGMKLYLGTEKLDKDGVRMALAEHDALFFQYKKAKQQRNIGTALLIGGIATFGIGAAISAENDDTATLNATAVIGLAGIGGKLWFNRKARRMVKGIASDYNALEAERYTSQYAASPVLNYRISAGKLYVSLCF